jgi:uncharacterized membrane protein
VIAATGLWMAASRWTLNLFWIRSALVLVVVVLLLLYAVVGPLLRRLIRLTDSEGPATPAWTRSELLFELVGGGSGLLVILIVWLMVTKPS